jgi:hypothetical protein
MLTFNRRPALDHLVALAAYLVSAVLFTLPLAGNFFSHVPGDNGDSIPHLWPFWYFAESLSGGLAGDGNMFHPLLQLYPDGISLVFANSSPIGAFLMSPVTWMAGPAAALNLWLTLHLWLGGWFFYRLCRNLGAGAWSAWLGGFAYACSPFVAVHIPGHFTLVQVGFTAAALFFLSEMAQRAASVAGGGVGCKYWVGPAAGLGISCWAVAATDFYLAVMTLFLLTAALGHLGMMHGRALVRVSFFRPLVVAVAISAVLLLPWVLLILQAREGNDYSALDPAMGSSNVARWSRLVTVPAYHSVWGPRMYPEFIGKFPGISEYTYLGMVGLFVAFVGLVVRRDWRAALAWAGAFVVALGLAGANRYTLDPAWPEGHPLSFGRWWPTLFPLSEFRVPGRWQFALCTALAVGVALGVDGLLRRKRPAGRALLATIIFILMAFDLLRWPMPLVEARPLESAIAPRNMNAGAVLDIPVGIRSGTGHSVGQFDRETLLRQMVHGRPVLSANAARLANNVVAERQADKELQALVAVQSGDEQSTTAELTDWPLFMDRYNITTIRIPTDWPTSAALRQMLERSESDWRWSEGNGELIGDRIQ